jgi:hypothetical protein
VPTVKGARVLARDEIPGGVNEVLYFYTYIPGALPRANVRDPFRVDGGKSVQIRLISVIRVPVE